YHFDRATSKFLGLHQVWHDGGPYYPWRAPVPGVGRDGIAINTHSPVVAEEQLHVQGAIAVRLGLPHAVALRRLTVHPPPVARVHHRPRSFEVGTAAAPVAWNGAPIAPRSSAEMTVVIGTICYRRDKKRPAW